MYLHDDSSDQTLQVSPSSLSEDKRPCVVSLVPNRHTEDMDPLGGKVFDTAKNLLNEHDQISVKDVLDAVGIDVGESAIRDRLNALVESGCLECLPGAGRRPTFYYLPERFQPDQDLDDQALLKLLRQDKDAKSHKVSELQEKLDAAKAEVQSVDDDIQALERVIAAKARVRKQFQNGQEA